jgi:hypothetical protein
MTNGDDVPVVDWPPTTVKAPLGVAKTVTVEAPTGLVNATDTWLFNGVTTIFVTFVVPTAVLGIALVLLADEGLLPVLLVATTVNVYALLFVKPVTQIGPFAPVPVNPPGLEVTVYNVMIAPPLLRGAVNETIAAPSDDVAFTTVGALGALAGVTAADAADAAPVPAALFAVTVNVYGNPFVKSVTTSGEVAPLAVSPPGLEVAV